MNTINNSYLILIATILSIFSIHPMDQGPSVQPPDLPLEMVELVLLKLADQDAAEKRFENLRELLKCRQACKQWKNGADNVYQNLLRQEQSIIDQQYAIYDSYKDTEFGDFYVTYIEQYANTEDLQWIKEHHRSMYNTFGKDFNKEHFFPRDSFGILQSIKNNLVYWLHNYYNNHPKRIRYHLSNQLLTNLIPLHLAAKEHKLAVVQLLLGLGADPSKTYHDDNDSALSIAISNNDTAMAKTLIKAGAKLTYSISHTEDGDYGYYCHEYDALEHAQKMNNHELIECINESQKTKKRKFDAATE